MKRQTVIQIVTLIFILACARVSDSRTNGHRSLASAAPAVQGHFESELRALRTPTASTLSRERELAVLFARTDGTARGTLASAEEMSAVVPREFKPERALRYHGGQLGYLSNRLGGQLG